MKISDLIREGLKCPVCGGMKIRAGYHDYQSMDSFICEVCGTQAEIDIAFSEFEHIRPPYPKL